MNPKHPASRPFLVVESLETRTLLAVDFSLAAMSDTQYVVESFPNSFARQTAWVAAHKADPNYNFAFLAHQGDLLRRGYSTAQAHVAAAALKNLDDAAIPYAVSIGNHDYDNQFDDLNRHVSSAAFASRFGDARYQPQIAAGKLSEYGSSLDQRNHYHVFTAGGRQFLVLSLEWQVPTAAQQWAQSVIDSHPTLPVILQTHEYLAGTVGSRTTSTPYDAAQLGAQNGQSIFTNLVQPNPQIFMVLSGHTGATWNRVVTTSLGKTVYEIAADFEGSQPNGGDGWLQTVGFDLGDAATGRLGSLTVKNVRPGDNGGADTFGATTTYSNVDFNARFTFADRTPPTPVTPGATPVATGEALATPESKAIAFNPVANDTDADSTSLKAILTALPAHGALYVNNDGTFTYTPDPKFVGVDAFAYAVTDGQTKTDPVTTTVNVRPAAPLFIYPTAETTTAGTRGGSIANVTASDGVVETIKEVISSTNADVDQRYTFNVTAGADATDAQNLLLGFNAWRTFSNPGTGDEYHPQVSTNGSTWLEVNQIVVKGGTDVVRTKFDADEPYQLFQLPIANNYSGPLYVRFTDVNPGGTETVDTLSVDEIFVRSAVSFPTVSIAKSADGAETASNSRPATFTVTRSGAGASIRNPLTVSFTLGGTATIGADYAAPANYAVTIPAGASSTTFSLTPIDDGIVEDSETIVATLAADNAYDVSATAGQATATIADHSTDVTPPTAPSGLLAATTSTTVTLTWSASTDDVGVTAYDVRRAGVLIATLDAGATTFTDTNRAPATTYAYTITARDDAGNVSPAATASATTRLAAPTNVTATKVKSGSKYTAKLTWKDASATESGFYVYTSRDNGQTWTRAATIAPSANTGGTLTWTSGTLLTGTTLFRVTAFDATKLESDPGASASVLV